MAKSSPKLEFTGERFIPELNQGAAFFYEHLARYLFASTLVSNKSVLDAGSGAGYGCYLLSKYGQAKSVKGVDISSEVVAYALEKYGLKNVSFEVDDITKLETVNTKSVQTITAFEVIEHIKEQDKFLAQVKRALKPKGLFIVSTPNTNTYPKGNEYHLRELSPQEFKEMLGGHFDYVQFFHQNFEISQIIKQEKSELKQLEFKSKFNIYNQQVLAPAASVESSQYIIALCSNDRLPKAKTLSINSSKVDGFDFSKGVISLGDQFSQLAERLDKHKVLAEKYQAEHSRIKNSFRQLKIEDRRLFKSIDDLVKKNQTLDDKIFELYYQRCQTKDKLEALTNTTFFNSGNYIQKSKNFFNHETRFGFGVLFKGTAK